MMADRIYQRLLPAEVTDCMMLPSISTITFYSGVIEESELREKVVKLLLANPWLAGRLVKNAETKSEITLMVPVNIVPSHYCASVLITIDDDELHSGISYRELFPRFSERVVKIGPECLNKDETLFKITLVRMQHTQSSAIIVSMNHVLGDGHTFYNIYSMLDKDKDVRALNSNRVEGFEAQVETLVGHDSRTWFRSNNFILGAVLNLLRFPRLHTRVAAVSGEEIVRRKNVEKMLLPSDGFVSANDVLTSWFVTTFKVSFTMMAINLRNRIDGITEDRAGNYEHVITYRLDDAASPSLIRTSLASVQSQSKWIPSMWDLWGGNSGLISNWASFYSDVNFSSAKPILHMPLVTFVSTVQYPLRAMAIIFKATSTKTGIMIFTRGHSESVMHRENENKLLHDMSVEF